VTIVSFLTAVIVTVIYCIYEGSRPQWTQATKDILVAETRDVYKYSYAGEDDNVFLNGQQVLKDGELVYGSDSFIIPSSLDVIHCGPKADTAMLDALGEEDKDAKAAIVEGCALAANLWFLVYISPMMAIGCDVVLAGFCFVTGVVGKVDDAHSVQRILMRFVIVVALLLTGLYACAMGASGSSLRLASTLMSLFLVALVVLCAWVYLELDLSVLKQLSSQSKIMGQLNSLAHSDWTRAMAAAVCGGPIFCWLVLNYLAQKFRKCRGVAEDPSDNFTPLARNFLEHVRDWKWTRVLLNICILGELFFMLQVGVAKATYIFLSWLDAYLTWLNIGILWVCFLVFFIGSCMFLLPPVPGLPVYIFAGVLLGAQGRSSGDFSNPETGFWMGCLIASCLGLFTKCCACVGQYMIGYFLGRSIKVQQLIGVDKVPTRAIEKVLKSRGLNPGKVALLVGGPDWPTSVTCGIIGVNIPQMLLGTLPVGTLLIPCVLAGACLGRVTPGKDDVWSMMANGSTMFAVMVNGISMAFAVYTVSMTIQKDGEELAKPRPEHEAVAELTRQEEAAVDAYRRTIEWHGLSGFFQASLLIAACGMLLSNGMFTGLAEMCFLPFSLSNKITDDVEDGGLDGNAISIILPMGWFGIGMFFVSMILHILFVKVMAARAKRTLLESQAA
jgi:hypothetical protein